MMNTTPIRKHTVQLIIGYGEFFYEGRPLLDAWQDNNASALFAAREVYLNNYRIGGMPQAVAGAGYRFTGRKSWYFSLSLDYAARIYVQPNPDRRTSEATAKYTTGEAELAQRVVAQQQLPSYYFVNALAGKSFRIARKYFLQTNMSVNNLLNRTDIMVSGFEQMRWDQAELEMFPPKYSYMNGISLLLSISLNFK
jgi:hypothetical protein